MIRGSHLIVGVSLLLIVGVVATYAMSIAVGHVEPLWCYISYTGNYPVESCVFSAVFSLSSAVYVLIVFLRYAQVSELLSDADLPEAKLKKLNVCNSASLLLGGLGVFGLSIAGCFQQRVFHFVHLIGVFLCTYVLLLYFMFQTYLTFAISSGVTFVKVFRLLVVVCASGILIIAPIFVLYVFIKCHRHLDVVSSSVGNSHEVGVKLGAVFEWILFLIYELYVFSFYSGFRNIVLRKDKIEFLELGES